MTLGPSRNSGDSKYRLLNNVVIKQFWHRKIDLRNIVQAVLLLWPIGVYRKHNKWSVLDGSGDINQRCLVSCYQCRRWKCRSWDQKLRLSSVIHHRKSLPCLCARCGRWEDNIPKRRRGLDGGRVLPGHHGYASSNTFHMEKLLQPDAKTGKFLLLLALIWPTNEIQEHWCSLYALLNQIV